jgi:hypothetical protein
MKTKLALAAVLLEGSSETADLLPGLLDCDRQARRKVRRRTWLFLLLILVAIPFLGFALAVAPDLDMLEEASGYALVGIPIYAAIYWPVTLSALAILIAGGIWVARLYRAYRTTQYLDEHMEADPEIVGAARREISTGAPETVFRAVSVFLAVILVVAGVAWGALVFIVTVEGIACAKSAKCI